MPTPNTDALLATEAECAEGRTAPRVSLADIEANIGRELTLTGGDIERALSENANRASDLDTLTICILTTKSGFNVIGKSAPASAANFDPVLGAKLAREDAIRQLWPLMGFALRERLHTSETPQPDRAA